jgi:transcriptional regulator with XRE-family HTH domain
LARTIKDERLKKGLSVEQLSKRSGVSWGIIRQIESASPSYVPSEDMGTSTPVTRRLDR